jgi:hypothetical protein
MYQKRSFLSTWRTNASARYQSLFATLKLLFFCAALLCRSCTADEHIPKNFFNIRGGLVPSPPEDGSGVDFYEQFELDYGRVDSERHAGSMRGFLKTGALSSLPESDPFVKWLNKHLETGAKPLKGRVKPFMAADFGRKSDLVKGENPVRYFTSTSLQSFSTMQYTF